jgi:hypothetical protein
VQGQEQRCGGGQLELQYQDMTTGASRLLLHGTWRMPLGQGHTMNLVDGASLTVSWPRAERPLHDSRDS